MKDFDPPRTARTARRNAVAAAERAAAARVKVERMRRGWTQADLAERLAGHGFVALQTTVAKIEGGTRPLRLGEFIAIAHAFDMPWQSLVGATDPLIHADETVTDMEAHLAVLQAMEDAERAGMIEQVTALADAYAEVRAERLTAENRFREIRRVDGGASTNAAE